jgi:hypothetical protein
MSLAVKVCQWVKMREINKENITEGKKQTNEGKATDI